MERKGFAIMKRFLAVLILVVLGVSLFGTAYADDRVIRIYDFDGNLVENPDLSKPWLYGAVFNADGTMVPQTRANVVEGYITLSAGQSWTSYQYQLSNATFGVGIRTPAEMSGNTYEVIQKASSVGGSRTTVKSKTVTPSTSQANAFIQYDVTNSTYLNAKYTNRGTTSSTFYIQVGWD